MLETLNTIEREGLASLAAIADADALEKWRIEFLGTKGRVKQAAGGLKDVSPADKPAVGKRLNEVSRALQEAFDSKQGGIGAGAPKKATGPLLDLTEPGVAPGVGRRHILTRTVEDLCEVFGRMGFEVAEGFELEDDDHNFVKLNIPADHPARDPIDNFYVDDPRTTATPRMLRSQTSTVQIRVMESVKPRSDRRPGGSTDPTPSTPRTRSCSIRSKGSTSTARSPSPTSRPRSSSSPALLRPRRRDPPRPVLLPSPSPAPSST